MSCSRCQTEPPSDAEFCPNCGVKVGVECWNCHTTNRLLDQFCKHCGHRVAVPPERLSENRTRDRVPGHLAELILRSRSAIEGERKVVTVLFADIKGSTELLAGLDPEAARALLDPVLARMIDAVHRYEGTVNQVLGDGVMALFGAPLAHEDHAVRACHAALAMRESVQAYARDLQSRSKPGIDIRIGLNSGEVVIRAIENDLHMDYSAVGFTTHLAARMEQLAPANNIWMTDITCRLARRGIEADRLDPQTVRGVSEPVQVWRLVAARTTRWGSELDADHLSPFVGRLLEMEFLERARESSESGDMRVIGISGDAGVGKTRLSLEFVQMCRQRGAHVWTLRAEPHGRARPLSLLLHFLRQYFGIEPSSDSSTSRRAIHERLAELGTGLEAASFVDLLENVDVVQMTTTEDKVPREALFDAIQRIIRVESSREFLVILIEDLHWLDVASEVFVEAIVDALPGTRALMVATFRPPYSAEWMRRSYYEQVPLPPLRKREAAILFDALVGQQPSVGLLRGQLLDRVQGNPFFLEELVRSLAESGVLVGERGAYEAPDIEVEVDLPMTVNAVLTSRIDRLPQTVREVLQTASVIGKDFSHPVLAKIVDISENELGLTLRTLLQGEFILRAASTDLQAYSFRHPLTQEASYQSLVSDRRTRLHRRIASALKALYPDRLSELAGLIALHREAAGDLKGAAGYTTVAAMWVGLSDPRQAVTYWAQAWDMLKQLPEDDALFQLKRLVSGHLLGLAWRVGMPLDEAREYYATSVELAIRADDVRAQALSLASYGRVLASQGSADEYVALAEQALGIALERRDTALFPLLYTMVGQARRMAGLLDSALLATEEALRYADHAKALGTMLAGFNVGAWMLGVRAQCLSWLGRQDDARVLLDELIGLTASETDLSLRLMPRVIYAEIASLEKDARLADAQRAAAEALLEEGRTPYLRVLTLAITGIATLLGGNARSAAEALEAALDVARTNRVALDFEARMLCDLSDAQLSSGLQAEALATAYLAADIARLRSNRISLCLAEIRIAAAQRLGTQSEREEARQTLRQAESLMSETHAVALRPLLDACRKQPE